jgi:anti-sigma28 factor (negative regulator of flagellin synthesis)
MLAGATDTSSLRQAKIQALRAEIADGTFESQERIDGTVDQLIKVLS